MARANLSFLAFNRGLVSRLGLARLDVKRLAMSAQVMTNFVCRVLGSMMLRPGLGYTGGIYNNLAEKMLDFVFSTTDTALVELTDMNMRVWVNDAVVTRPSVSSAVTNGTFATNLTGWTQNDEAGATSSWVAPSYLQLVGNGVQRAIRDQQVSVTGGNIGVEHALKIIVARGPVVLRVGTAQGDDFYVAETTLDTGNHSLAFTPTGPFWIRFASALKRVTWVDNCTIEAAGVMLVPTNWAAAVLDKVRKDQSGDILFVACEGQRQQKIERRAIRSWSVVDYLSNDGPFLIENVGPITMTAAALTGNTTLTASAPYFKSTNVGSLFSVTSTGQQVTSALSAQNTFTNVIKVTGVADNRNFAVAISGTFSATVTLQRSFDNVTWLDAGALSPGTTSLNDMLDNQIVYYRVGIKTGDYVSGTADITITYSLGTLRGLCRITSLDGSNPTTVANVEVLADFGGTAATDTWAEGQWSDRRGWPTAVAFAEGRLFWVGKDQCIGSVSDAFSSFDPDTMGDSGPIQRTIGSGPVDTINWVLALQRLILGGQGAEFVCKTSSLDEPLTPTNFSIRRTSTQGSAGVGAVVLDDGGIYVQRGGIRVFSMQLDPQSYGNYASSHLTAIVPQIGKPGITRIAVQRQPDTRVHFVRSDGTVALLVFDRNENVNAWMEIETTGLIEDVVVLPSQVGEEEDHVYYVVNRTINGATVRYLERWATEEQCIGGTLNLQADSYVTYSGAPATVIPCAHLSGTVVAWGDGLDLGTFVVAAGAITLPVARSSVVVGLGYTAQWKSGKLSEIPMQLGTPLTQKKKIDHLGVILCDSHTLGLQYGPDFDNLSDLPRLDEGIVYDPTEILSEYDGDAFPFEGGWNTDSRLCLQAAAPRPVTLLAAIATVAAFD